MRNILFYLFLLLTFVIGLVFLSQGSYKMFLGNPSLSANNLSPPLNININMSGNGTFKIYLPGENVISVSSQWMQDDLNKRLYISAGDSTLGDPFCLNHFYFVTNKHYVVSFEGNNCQKPICECISGYGYQEEVDHYNSTYLGYMGRQFNPKLQKEVDVYGGRTLDGVGPITVQMYVGVDPRAYLGLNILESKNVTGLTPYPPYFNEYLYQDVELRVPDSKYFIVPQGCLDVETEKGCTSFPYDIYGNKIIN